MLGVVWPNNHAAFPDFYNEDGKTKGMQWFYM
jgi:hypothetical protein